jgi:ketosteroid isomerase-like protein
MADLEARLEALEHEREINRVLNAYAHSIDYGPEAAWLDLFTADAVLSYDFDVARSRGQTERENMRFEGREEIAGFWRHHTHAPDRYHKHFMVEPQIVIDGDTAAVECYYAKLDETPDGPRMSSFGRYRDRLRREADGRWRFATREAETEARVPGNR